MSLRTTVQEKIIKPNTKKIKSVGEAVSLMEDCLEDWKISKGRGKYYIIGNPYDTDVQLYTATEIIKEVNEDYWSDPDIRKRYYNWVKRKNTTSRVDGWGRRI